MSMRSIWLSLRDPGIKAVLGALKAAGPGLGDLAENPSAAPAFFRPLRAALSAAAKIPPSSPAAAAALAAAEDLTGRLEKLFSDLHLHRTAPDRAVLEALLYLQRACAEAPGLLSPRGRSAAAAGIGALAAGARKSLALAGAAAAGPAGNFPENLKFSSIYTGLEAVLDAYERCAESLFKV